MMQFTCVRPATGMLPARIRVEVIEHGKTTKSYEQTHNVVRSLSGDAAYYADEAIATPNVPVIVDNRPRTHRRTLCSRIAQ